MENILLTVEFAFVASSAGPTEETHTTTTVVHIALHAFGRVILTQFARNISSSYREARL